jgi:hypothetical protein
MSLVISIFFFVIGAILVAWSMQAIEPINIEQLGSQIKATLDPTFILLLAAGSGSLGIGVGSIAFTGQIYLLEKQLTNKI